MLKKKTLLWQVLIAIALALLVGGLSTPDSEVLGIRYIALFGFLGQLFLNALTLLVVPLVSASIIHGIGQMGKDKSFGRLGGKTFFFYILTTFLAVLTGLIVVNIIQPGTYMAPPAEGIPPIQTPSQIEAMGEILTKLIPLNIFKAAS